ncbi:Planctomycete cytochrome C [Rubripirellula lacrimiformis]|uniref:Planctomycete cytochrome C n=1 Tax=Rubripirellula lacrimiformis TaxID=1930273 RepID=A0A517N5J3_9BACT|nr:PSD1 and planctomycete cytochrome C domain-containing protein [Rubripirellula lacrimiformis]QDT02298.1 Planctomycete cytochrome C [Rubripirellula lacrimiformis]
MVRRFDFCSLLNAAGLNAAGLNAAGLNAAAMNAAAMIVVMMIVAGTSFPRAASAGGLTPREEFFENQVRPLLIGRCQECHDASLQESDLRLDSRALVLQGGISGPAAIARNVDESAIIQAVLGQGNFQQMPPDDPLSQGEIAILKKWVRIGLPWPGDDDPVAPALGDQVAIVRAAQSHWAFLPVVHPTPPDVSGLPWAGDLASSDQRVSGDEIDSASAGSVTDVHPIDAFIWETLHDHQLQPNPPAARRVLLRRLYFDLIGLPPTSEQLDALEQDSRPDDVVLGEWTDRLLASEHHGERWARYWLDLARYADTRDWQAQAELRYPYAYTYRDYVIHSLNDDKPYDQFVKEQIAADLYLDPVSTDPAAVDSVGAETLAALGMLTVGPRFRNNQLEQMADKIDVVCRGLMGITVACARCHDHKYDPVPIEDFYSLYGVFASSVEPQSLPIIPGHQPAGDIAADFQAQLAAAQGVLADYKERLKQQADKALRSDLPKYFDGFVMMTIQKKADIRGTISKLKVEDIVMTPLNNRLAQSLKDKRLAKHPVLAPWQQGLSISAKQFADQRQDLIRQWLADQDLNARIRSGIESAPPKTQGDLVAIYADAFDHVIGNAKAVGKANAKGDPKSPPKIAKLDADDEAIRRLLLGPGGWLDLDVEAVANASRLTGKGRKALGDRLKAITEVEASHPGAPPKAMSLVDLEKPVTPFVMLRGEPARRGDRVPRQFLELIAGPDRQPFRVGSGRRELAEAIVDPSNPLTARVAVNRVWARYFGEGLALSLDDFGLRSDPPSHPELLDWLAAEFIRNGWSMKWLHRTIVTSQTYRQSAAARDDGLLADPTNRWLWRQSRRRLDFEAMRDSMLSVAGVLDPAIGGRSIRLSEQPYSFRRSVYAYVDRIELDPMLRTFDFASPTASSASRAETTIPQQALFGMNHPLVAQLCRRIAADCRDGLGRPGNTDGTAQVQSIYRRVYGRAPTAQELSVSLRFIHQAENDHSTFESTWQYGYGPLRWKFAPNGTRGPANGGFTPLPHWTGAFYQASDQFPDPVLKHVRMTNRGGHPGDGDAKSLIRRWTAPDDGVVSVSGTLKHSRDGSDGVVAAVRTRVDSTGFVAAQSTVETAVDRIEVKRGDVVDFVVSAGPTTRADSFAWTVVVQGIEGQLAGRTWDSVSDFQGPPPPPLSPLAQLAQGLMLTNEFLYLD